MKSSYDLAQDIVSPKSRWGGNILRMLLISYSPEGQHLNPLFNVRHFVDFFEHFDNIFCRTSTEYLAYSSTHLAVSVAAGVSSPSVPNRWIAQLFGRPFSALPAPIFAIYCHKASFEIAKFHLKSLADDNKKHPMLCIAGRRIPV